MKKVTIFKRVNGHWMINKITSIGFTEARIKAFETVGMTVRALTDKIFVDNLNNEFCVCDR